MKTKINRQKEQIEQAMQNKSPIDIGGLFSLGNFPSIMYNDEIFLFKQGSNEVLPHAGIVLNWTEVQIINYKTTKTSKMQMGNLGVNVFDKLSNNAMELLLILIETIPSELIDIYKNYNSLSLKSTLNNLSSLGGFNQFKDAEYVNAEGCVIINSGEIDAKIIEVKEEIFAFYNEYRDYYARLQTGNYIAFW